MCLLAVGGNEELIVPVPAVYLSVRNAEGASAQEECPGCQNKRFLIFFRPMECASDGH